VLNIVLLWGGVFSRTSPGIVPFWDDEISVKVRDIVIEIGTIKTLDEYFMDKYIR
jgi:hypothetical protein